MPSQEGLGHYLKPRSFLKTKCINEITIHPKEEEFQVT